jgi:hypothetical protein
VSIIATAVKHLIAAGVTGDALVAAIAEMEAATDTRSSAAKRQARYRENLDVKASQTVTNRNSDADKEKSPQTPLKEIQPISPKGDTPPFDFQTEWNSVAKPAGLRVCQAMNRSRMAQLRQRLAEHGPDGLRRAIAAAAASDFCRGVNDRGWRAGPSFVLQAESCLKLLEGQYEGKRPAASDSGGSFLAHLTGSSP